MERRADSESAGAKTFTFSEMLSRKILRKDWGIKPNLVFPEMVLPDTMVN